MRGCRGVLLFLALSLLSVVAVGAQKGWFGFAISVDAEGLALNPTIRSVTVQSVLPSSPAALSGMAAGDVVLEVQGVTVAGAKADVLKAAMQKSVGETLHLKILRGGRETKEFSLVAVPKPVGQ